MIFHSYVTVYQAGYMSGRQKYVFPKMIATFAKVGHHGSSSIGSEGFVKARRIQGSSLLVLNADKFLGYS